VNGHASVFRMMVGVAIFCGFAIAVVYEATGARIAANRHALLQAAVASVLPGVARLEGYRVTDEAIAPESIDRATFIAGYDTTGSFIGVAVPASIVGYQDTIDMLFGYDPAQQQLTGFAVLQSRETPGLGAKIATDPAFLASLGTLDVMLDGTELVHDVTLATREAERRPYQVDGITGATVSSSAVVRAVNNSASRFAEIRARIGGLQHAPEGDHAG
jgi:electron transport complex protein RnfG